MSTSHRYARTVWFAPVNKRGEPIIALRNGKPWLLHPTKGWLKPLPEESSK